MIKKKKGKQTKPETSKYLLNLYHGRLHKKEWGRSICTETENSPWHVKWTTTKQVAKQC